MCVTYVCETCNSSNYVALCDNSDSDEPMKRKKFEGILEKQKYNWKKNGNREIQYGEIVTVICSDNSLRNARFQVKADNSWMFWKQLCFFKLLYLLKLYSTFHSYSCSYTKQL